MENQVVKTEKKCDYARETNVFQAFPTKFQFEFPENQGERRNTIVYRTLI